jgi:hypothetical protein
MRHPALSSNHSYSTHRQKSLIIHFSIMNLNYFWKLCFRKFLVGRVGTWFIWIGPYINHTLLRKQGQRRCKAFKCYKFIRLNFRSWVEVSLNQVILPLQYQIIILMNNRLIIIPKKPSWFTYEGKRRIRHDLIFKMFKILLK